MVKMDGVADDDAKLLSSDIFGAEQLVVGLGVAEKISNDAFEGRRRTA